MANAIERMIANNLADFEGLRLEGTLVVSEALVNAFIGDYLNSLKTPASATDPPTNNTALDVPKLLQSLHIDQAQVQLQEQKLHIQLKIRR
jgi:hypothetical protein